jgi:hypothetical protein
MIAFEVELNGKPLGVAGSSDLSVLSATVTAVGKLGDESRGSKDRADDVHLDVAVGGLTGRADATEDEYVDWVKEDIKVGDTFTLRVVETDIADPAKFTKLVKKESNQKKYFDWAKDFYLAHRDKYEES